MRKIYFYAQLFLLAVIGLASCSDDNRIEKRIIGKWHLTSIGEYVGTPTVAYCIFRKDGTCTAYFNSLSADGKYVVENDELRIKEIEVPLSLLLLFVSDAEAEDLYNKYDFLLKVEAQTKTSLRVTGVFLIQYTFYQDSETFPIKINMERV